MAARRLSLPRPAGQVDESARSNGLNGAPAGVTKTSQKPSKTIKTRGCCHFFLYWVILVAGFLEFFLGVVFGYTGLVGSLW